MAFAMSIFCCQPNVGFGGFLVADLPTGTTAQGSYDFELVPSTPNHPSVFPAGLDGNKVVADPSVFIELSNASTTYYLLVVQH